MATPDNPEASQLPVTAEGHDRDGEIFYSAGDAGATGFRTAVAVVGTTNDATFDFAMMTFFCDADDPDGAVFASARAFWMIGDDSHNASLDDDMFALVKFGKVYEGEWDNWGFVVGAEHILLPNATAFMQQAMLSEYLQVALPGAGGPIVATFDLRGVFDTPVQPNLDYCGQYGRARELVTKATPALSQPALLNRAEAAPPIQAEWTLARNNEVAYQAGDMGAAGFRTVLTIFGRTTDSVFDEAALSFFCDVDDPDRAVWASFRVQFAGEDGLVRRPMHDDDLFVLAKFGRVHQGTWDTLGFIPRENDALLPDATDLLRTAKENNYLQILISQEESQVTATFDLREAFNTPIQPNLDCCGEYGWEYDE